MPVVEPETSSEIVLALAALPRDVPIALAVSGGADSIALMLAASRLLPSGNLTVLSVDHGLRAAAAGEAAQVAGWAKAAGLRHVTLRWQEAKPETGIQAAAREARYQLMTGWCMANDVAHLVTAHNLDDQAETVLMRLKRGSGVDGLAGMAKQSWRSGVQLLRPLLDVPHDVLVASLQQAAHPWIEDPSNTDEQYERIQVRNSAETLNALGLSNDKLVATARRMSRAREALEQATRQLLATCADVSEYGFCQLRAAALGGAADELAIRALSRCIQAVGGGAWPPSDEPLERVLDWVRTGTPDATTLGGCRLVLRGEHVLVARELGRITERRVNLSGGERLMWDGRFQIAAKGQGPELQVGPLAKEGWADLKAERPDLPAFVGQTLPAIRRGQQIIAVPSIAYVSPETIENRQFSARFTNSQLICRKTS
ncbi:MAG: tRNA lysidine(34) synthetase TilS [Alphaproteobacteria bacterium]|nr:tRNA lysidine(34) synthetase TilS [Alphaproteobacteria bacterium]